MYCCTHLLQPNQFLEDQHFGGITCWWCSKDGAKVLEGTAMFSPVAYQVKSEELDLDGLFKNELFIGGRYVKSCVN